ncbi:MAG: hypothetical protein OXE75_05235 [bacterium]|nr:hypothetical protein [bacterium]
MIESPEIEVVRRELEREVLDRRVKSVEVLSEGVTPHSAEELNQRLGRAKIIGEITRQGLQLLLSFDNEEVMGITLGAGGHLRRQPNRDRVDPATRLVITFTQFGGLRLLDFKEGARMRLLDPEQISEQQPTGIDPLVTSLSWTDFSSLLAAPPRPMYLKAFLTNAGMIVGVGDMYADEILFNAGLRHDRLTDSLGRQEIRRLWRAIVEVLHDAVKYRGSTLEDNHFVSPSGEPGAYQNHHNVYRRQGRLSPRSRRPIVRIKYRGRWTYYCEQSQV